MGIPDIVSKLINDRESQNDRDYSIYEQAKSKYGLRDTSTKKTEIALSGVAKIPETKSNYQFSTLG